jgi:transposase
MEFIEGTSRHQATILPVCIEDYVDADNPVRVIDAFVDSLDLATYSFAKHSPNSTGRPMYDPKDMLKLFLYGYMNRIRSSRRLEAEARRNIEVMWLIRRLVPDHKTIARFRHDNPQALKGVFRGFVGLCAQLGLAEGAIVAVDGSKFKASNSKDRNFTKGKLEDRIARIDTKITEYITAMDTADAEEDPVTPATAEVASILEGLKERRQEYIGYLEEIGDGRAGQKSLTDPDSRLMKSGGAMQVAYNTQIAVDAKHGIIAAFEATNSPFDSNLLPTMADAAAEALGVEGMAVIADAGYDAATGIAECIMAGHDPHVAGTAIDICLPAKPGEGQEVASYECGRTVYIKERNIAICPMGKTLYPSYYRLSRCQAIFKNPEACRLCACKCTSDACLSYTLTMPKDEFTTECDTEGLETRQVRVRPDRELVGLRKSVAEHPFGTIKRAMLADHCLMRGLTFVNGEFALAFLAYNLKRVISIVGVRPLLKVLAP